MTSEKEIVDALKLLRSVCVENNGKCSKCILRNAECDCGIFMNSVGDYHDSLMDLELKNYDFPRVILN